MRVLLLLLPLLVVVGWVLLVWLRVLRVLLLLLHVCLHPRQQPLGLRAQLLLLGDRSARRFEFLLPVGDYLKQPLVGAQARVQNATNQALAVTAYAYHTTATAAAARISEQKQGRLVRIAVG